MRDTTVMKQPYTTLLQATERIIIMIIILIIMIMVMVMVMII